MERFTQRPGTDKPTYDFAMPANGDTYGGSSVKDSDGTVHVQVTHSKVRIWSEQHPEASHTVTIVYGNAGGSDPLTISGGAAEYVVPKAGLVSVVSEDGSNLVCYADIFGVWTQ